MTVILRVREQLDSVICTSAKTSVTAQSNALLALSALSQATRCHVEENNTDSTADLTELSKWEKNLITGVLAVAKGAVDK